ncbi:MAG: MerR family transcriptional regulator [Bacteroidota bacterium]
MNQFSIRDIEHLCGIKAHTLRIWEQRYKLFVAKRKDNKHRIYDNDDLKELLCISFLYHNGYKVSKLAELTADQRQEALVRTVVKEDNHELFIYQLIEASVDFDKERFDKIINSLVIRSSLEKAIFQIFYPFLQRIGLLWMTNNVIPAQEHFSSHIIRKKIICAIDGLELNSLATIRVLLFAPAGEHHEIPLLAADYLLKKNNIRTVYFGVNMQLEPLQIYLSHHPVDFIYTHVTSCPKNTGLDSYPESLCKIFPGKKVLMSGPVTKLIKRKPGEVIIVHSPDELITFIREAEKQKAAAD